MSHSFFSYHNTNPRKNASVIDARKAIKNASFAFDIVITSFRLYIAFFKATLFRPRKGLKEAIYNVDVASRFVVFL